MTKIPREFYNRQTADAVNEWMKGYAELSEMARAARPVQRRIIILIANGTHWFVYTMLRLAAWSNSL